MWLQFAMAPKKTNASPHCIHRPTDRNLLFMRPQVLDATRVRENWFLVSPSMARYYQSEGGGVNVQFSPASGPLVCRFLRCGPQTVEYRAWDGAPCLWSEGRMAVARQAPPIAQDASD